MVLRNTSMLDFPLLIIAILILIKITYNDYKTKNISDIDSLIIMILSLFYNINIFFFDSINIDEIILNTKLIAYAIGTIFILKIVSENILYTSKGFEDELLGEGDIILFGALAPFLKTYTNFLIMIYMATMIMLMYLFILNLSKTKSRKNQYPFVPAISTAFIVTVISTLI